MSSSKKISSLVSLLLGVGVLVMLNLLSAYFHYRIDFTKEKRFTLSPVSMKLASQLDDRLTVKVYLEGEFPAAFQRLRNETKQILDEFDEYAGRGIDYEFIDPLEGLDKEAQNNTIEQFSAKGLQPLSLQVNSEDEISSKTIFPCALFTYKGNDYPVTLLKGQFGEDPEDVVNASIENLEYEVGNVLRKCTLKKKKRLAFLIGHGELDKYYTADAVETLSDFYEVERLDYTLHPPSKLMEYEGIIIAKPTTKFSEYDKYKLDQYIMKGGEKYCG